MIRARELYAVFLTAGSKSQPDAFIEHVNRACEKTGGRCVLSEEITDEEVEERLGK